jgi:hypothetical protein
MAVVKEMVIKVTVKLPWQVYADVSGIVESLIWILISIL